MGGGVLGGVRTSRAGMMHSPGSLWTGLQGVPPTGHAVLPVAPRQTGARASPASPEGLGTSGEDLSLGVTHKLLEEPEKKSPSWTCGPWGQGYVDAQAQTEHQLGFSSICGAAVPEVCPQTFQGPKLVRLLGPTRRGCWAGASVLWLRAWCPVAAAAGVGSPGPEARRP